METDDRLTELAIIFAGAILRLRQRSVLEISPDSPTDPLGPSSSNTSVTSATCGSPAGLVAVSVAAEIVALRWGGTGVPLTATDGAVHPRRDGSPGG